MIDNMVKKGSKTNKDQSSGPKTYVSKEISLNIKKLENEFYRADIEIHNVDCSVPSYEGRIFLNNPNANQKTEPILKNGYVGSYNIFGHAGCYGDIGHCDLPPGDRMYDFRPSHHLKPIYKRVVITDALKKLGKNTDKFTITIVPVIPGLTADNSGSYREDMVKFEKIGIITYD